MYTPRIDGCQCDIRRILRGRDGRQGDHELLRPRAECAARRGRGRGARRRVQGGRRPGAAPTAVAHRAGGRDLLVRPRHPHRPEPTDDQPPHVDAGRCGPGAAREAGQVGVVLRGARSSRGAARRARRRARRRRRVTPLPRRPLAEFLGTAFLVAVVVGSGIMAVRLSPHDVGLQLLENAIATGAGLVALILAFGSVSGAHFNPVVSLADAVLGGLTTAVTAAYVAAQVTGACLGCVVANLMFDLDAVTVSHTTRSSSGIWLGEAVATFGLLTVILGLQRSGRGALAP